MLKPAHTGSPGFGAASPKSESDGLSTSGAPQSAQHARQWVSVGVSGGRRAAQTRACLSMGRSHVGGCRRGCGPVSGRVCSWPELSSKHLEHGRRLSAHSERRPRSVNPAAASTACGCGTSVDTEAAPSRTSRRGAGHGLQRPPRTQRAATPLLLRKSSIRLPRPCRFGAGVLLLG